jgi:glucose-1-phosphate cytidylyltransferase
MDQRRLFRFRAGNFDYIDGDQTDLSVEPMRRLARDGQLMAYKHDSFWQCMDTLREKFVLEHLWESNKALWKVWP